MGVLAAANLGKRFGSRWLFRHIEFELARGQVLGVRGPNGSGKSTMLKVLAGLADASEGKVARPERDLRLSLGYAALDLAVYPHLSAGEHLELAGRLRNVEPRSEELLARVGLANVGAKPTSQFSSGMRARLRLAVAIQTDPAILLLDEPTAALDDAGRELVVELVADQRARGVAVVATNDPADRRFFTHEVEIA